METLTVREIAKYLKVHPLTIARLAREGKIPGFKVGKQWRFDKKEMEAWRRNQGKGKNTGKS